MSISLIDWMQVKKPVNKVTYKRVGGVPEKEATDEVQEKENVCAKQTVPTRKKADIQQSKRFTYGRSSDVGNILIRSESISTVPAKSDVLRHFLSKKEEYNSRIKNISDSKFGEDALPVDIQSYITKHSAKIPSTVIKQLIEINFVFPLLSLELKYLARAAYGYVISEVGTMIPHDVPNIGFADDTYVVKYVHDQIKEQVTEDMVEKACIICSEIKAISRKASASIIKEAKKQVEGKGSSSVDRDKRTINLFD